jgi:DNA-binding MarR family transcriptional regulator
MDYLRSGNDSHLVVGSEVVKMEKEPDTGLVALMTQISKALHRRTSEELLGMRLKQFLLLGYVRDHGNGGVSQQELETALLIDANSVVLLLNELEAAGLSVRRRDPHDRRRHVVELTPSGRVAVERAEKARESLEDEILADFSPEDRATLRKLLRRVLNGLLRAAPEPAKL